MGLEVPVSRLSTDVCLGADCGGVALGSRKMTLGRGVWNCGSDSGSVVCDDFRRALERVRRPTGRDGLAILQRLEWAAVGANYIFGMFRQKKLPRSQRSRCKKVRKQDHGSALRLSAGTTRITIPCLDNMRPI